MKYTYKNVNEMRWNERQQNKRKQTWLNENEIKMKTN